MLKVGHYTNREAQTGLTVFLLEDACPAGVATPGFAPASHEWAVLDPLNTVTGIDALLLTGGSAFGLAAAAGVMQYLKEQGRGVETGVLPVPIVPAAAIFDLAVGQPLAPTAEQAYQACITAKAERSEQGRIGAGTGASVGKFIQGAHALPGGLGFSELRNAQGLWVKAYAVVNAVGDVVDAEGQILAGACCEPGVFVNAARAWQEAHSTHEFNITQQSTTLVALFTNAKLDKLGASRLAHVASAGLAQALRPAFTPFDGDVVFAVSCGQLVAEAMVLAALGQEAVRQAIVNAVKSGRTSL